MPGRPEAIVDGVMVVAGTALGEIPIPLLVGEVEGNAADGASVARVGSNVGFDVGKTWKVGRSDGYVEDVDGITVGKGAMSLVEESEGDAVGEDSRVGDDVGFGVGRT